MPNEKALSGRSWRVCSGVTHSRRTTPTVCWAASPDRLADPVEKSRRGCASAALSRTTTRAARARSASAGYVTLQACVTDFENSEDPEFAAITFGEHPVMDATPYYEKGFGASGFAASGTTLRAMEASRASYSS